jgi:hypothetical protein
MPVVLQRKVVAPSIPPGPLADKVASMLRGRNYGTYKGPVCPDPEAAPPLQDTKLKPKYEKKS